MNQLNEDRERETQALITKYFQENLRFVDAESGHPNTELIWERLRDLDILKLNVKNMGYDIARALSTDRMSKAPEAPPQVTLGWRASIQADLESEWAAYWCRELGVSLLYHRKLWELCYVLQVLWSNNKIVPGARGLGFGCGEEAIPSYLAAKGVTVVATDLPPDHQNAAGWRDTAQHSDSLDRIWRPHLVDKPTFDHKVSLEYVDMNAIPAHLQNFDFCWSICALEHIGSIEQGLRFIENSMATLKPGGISVHTTEFNFRDGPTIDNWNTVLFQQSHFEDLARRLQNAGHRAEPISFDLGDGALDRFIDIPPYAPDLPSTMHKIEEYPAHLKLSVDGFPTTCFGVVVENRNA